MKNFAIESKNLSIGYGSKELYSNLNLEMHAGQVTALLGANGSGKSTLIKTLCGFIRPIAGSINIMGRPLSIYKREELAKQLSVVLTDRSSDGGLTVYETISLGRYPHTNFFGALTHKDRVAIDRAIEQVGITNLKDEYISRLSDGERQKVMIAKSFAQESPIIILDEPTAFLDISSRIEIVSLLYSLAAQNGKTVLISTHDLELALQLSNRLWIINREQGFLAGFNEDIVLSGALGHLLGSATPLFDYQTGTFNITKHNGKKVYLECPPHIWHWAANALSRMGFQPTTDNTDVELKISITDGTGKAIEISLSNQNQTNTYSSIEQLAEKLINL